MDRRIVALQAIEMMLIHYVNRGRVVKGNFTTVNKNVMIEEAADIHALSCAGVKNVVPCASIQYVIAQTASERIIGYSGILGHSGILGYSGILGTPYLFPGGARG